MNDPNDEIRNLLLKAMGEKCWEEFHTKIINTAMLLQQGLIREDTVHDFITKPLSEWMKELTAEQRASLRRSIEIDREIKGIIVDAVWAIQRKRREA